MSDVEWRDPPPATSNRSAPLRDVVAQLKKYPGKWARVARGANNSGNMHDLVKYGCDRTTRRRDDNTYDIYARWPEVK